MCVARLCSGHRMPGVFHVVACCDEPHVGAGFVDPRTVRPSIDFDEPDVAREVEFVPVDFDDGFDW